VHSEILKQTAADLKNWRENRNGMRNKIPANILQNIEKLKNHYSNRFLKDNLKLGTKILYPSSVKNSKKEKIQIAQLPTIEITPTTAMPSTGPKIAAEIILPNNITLRIFQ
jgi:mannosyltransferase OCH1-like enzyme